MGARDAGIESAGPAHSTAALGEAYARHLAHKEAAVRRMLAEHGLEGLFAGILPCPVEQGYRAYATFSVPRGAGAGIRGVDPRSGRVPWRESLWVLPERARAAVERVVGLLADAEAGDSVTGFDLRLEYGSGRAHLRLAAPRAESRALAPLCDAIFAEVPGLLGVALPAQGIERGEGFLRHRLHGRTVLAHHLAFFQTNWWLTPELGAEVQRGVEANGLLVDLYCGVGLHSLLAAGPESRVAGADNNRWAIRSAEHNVELHGLRGASYVNRPVERFVRGWSGEAPDAVFVNPSRWGCAPGVAEAVAGWRPRRVVLVSCSPVSHLRDTLDFVRAGYRPLGVRGFDMFPFSDFLECVSVLVPG